MWATRFEELSERSSCVKANETKQQLDHCLKVLEKLELDKATSLNSSSVNSAKRKIEDRQRLRKLTFVKRKQSFSTASSPRGISGTQKLGPCFNISTSCILLALFIFEPVCCKTNLSLYLSVMVSCCQTQN